jgi:hypothetical protein
MDGLMLLRPTSYGTILRQFRSGRVLYILGAGASSGHVPLSVGLLQAPALDYALGDSFPALVSEQSGLTRKSVATVTGSNLHTALSLIFPDRVVRPGTVVFPLEEMAQRQPDGFTLLHMMHGLAKPRFWKQQSDNYLAFRFLRPSVILNYNLDGLASDLCSSHKVITPHGTVDPGYGSPRIADLLTKLREFNIPVSPDNVTLCVPESDTDACLKSLLRDAYRQTPDFVAVIGYSFGRNGDAFDDHVSWEFFRKAFPDFSGDIYVIDPEPADLSSRISDARKSKNVFGVRAYWNVLAHAFVEVLSDKPCRRSLNYLYNHFLDTSGVGVINLR